MCCFVSAAAIPPDAEAWTGLVALGNKNKRLGVWGLEFREVAFVSGLAWSDIPRKIAPECAELPEVPMMLSVCFLVCFPKFGFFKKISEVKG